MASTLGSRFLGLEDCKSNSLVQCLGIEVSASLELSSESRRLNTDQRYGLAPMRGLDVNVGCRPGRLNWAQADQHLALVEITCCLDRLFETYDGNVHV